MADPALAGRQDHRLAELGGGWLLGTQFPLQRKLARQFGGGIGIGGGVGENGSGQGLEIVQQLFGELAFEEIAGEELLHLHLPRG
jgi:hypothetical protein